MNDIRHRHELIAEIVALRKALLRIIEASDQFIKDTGLKHGDLITDAVDEARRLVL